MGRCTVLAATISCLTAISGALPAAADDPFMPPLSNTGVVNEFITNSRMSAAPDAPTETIANLKIVVKLQAPLNSDFSKPGDPVEAEIAEPVAGLTESAMPVGSVLHGYVERSVASGRMSRHGQLYVRFYWIEQGGRWQELYANAGEMQGDRMPVRVTRKQVLRGILMTATMMAVPMAIGTGGMSLAITAGAGAVVGAALADDRKYVKGAVRGAWQGSGLSVLDPLVAKGKQVRLPAGQRLELALAEPLTLPAGSRARAPAAQPSGQAATTNAWGRIVPGLQDAGPDSVLRTSARIISANEAEKPAGSLPPDAGDIAPPAVVERCREYVSQKNLAAALDAAEKAHRQYPRDPELNKFRRELLTRVSGGAITVDDGP